MPVKCKPILPMLVFLHPLVAHPYIITTTQLQRQHRPRYRLLYIRLPSRASF